MPVSLPTQRARALRIEQTKVEGRLWECLRAGRMGGWKWRRQAPRGPFIVDFICARAGLVVELDGDHHAEQRNYDERRTAWLKGQVLRVLRFWNNEVIENLDGVCDTIYRELGGPAPADGEPWR